MNESFAPENLVSTETVSVDLAALIAAPPTPVRAGKDVLKKGLASQASTALPTKSDLLPLGKLQRVRTADVVVEDRFRKDLGDLKSLARSMSETGLAQPPLVDTQMRLVCGYRRLQAAKSLGWKEIPARVVDLEDPFLLTVAEDSHRKDLSPSEKYALYEAFVQRVQDEAWRARALGGRLDAASRRGRLDEEIGGHLKLSRESLRKIRAVGDAAKADPDAYQDLVVKLDQDGRVDRHFRELLRRQGRGDSEEAAAILVRADWEALLKDSSAKEVGTAASAAVLGAGAADGTLLLLPTSVRTLGEAVGVLRRCSMDWKATLRGCGAEGEDLWLVAMMGRKATLSPAALEIVAEGCSQGFEAAAEALEVAVDAGVQIVELKLGEPRT